MLVLIMCLLVACGEAGPQGPQGDPGKDGTTPVITIGSSGNWYINGVDTGVKAQGADGQNGAQGADGTSLLTGNGVPSDTLGKNGDSYIDLDNFDFYVKADGAWEKKGNIKGESGVNGATPDHDGTPGLEFYPINDTECAVSAGTARLLEEIVIPSTWKWYTVTTILGYEVLCEESGFFGCQNLKSITIPDSVTTIGSYAFAWCDSLTSIVIPEGVTTIGEEAFYYCDSLTSVTFGENSRLTTIGAGAFSGCTSLTDVYYGGTKEEWAQINVENCFDKDNRSITVHCSDGNIDINTGNTGIESKTIIFYSTQGDALQQITSNAIASFEAKYPGWKIDHRQPGGYDEVKDKIISDFQGGVQPDLAYCYPDHVAQYLQTGKVIDMTKFINSTEMYNGTRVGYTANEIADFIPGYYNEGLATNFGGYSNYGFTETSMLSMPFVKSTELLYYNKTALDALGLSVATTWDELWAQCELIVDRYPTATPLGYDSEANWFITMCKQNGWGYTSTEGNQYLFNNDKVASWLTELHSYYNEGYFTTQEDYGAYTSALFTKGVNDGGLVYCIGSSGGASHQDPGSKFEWGVAPVPGSKQADGTVNYSTIAQGPSLVMLSDGYNVSNSEEKQLMTWLFIKELLDPTFQAAFSIAAGYNPCRQSTFDVQEYKDHLAKGNIVAVAAEVASTMSDRFFTSPAFKGSSTAREQVGRALVYAIQGQKTPSEALDDAYRNCGA